MKIYNHKTKPDRRPPKSKDKGEIEEILEKVKGWSHSSIASIAGCKIKLLTNSDHVMKFWGLNWFPSNGNSHDGIVYSVKDIEGHEPHLYYNMDTREILIVNTEYYGSAKSAGALGLSGTILEEFEKHPIHGACVGIEKASELEGIVIIAPTGTGKTTQCYNLLYYLTSTKVHSDDYVFVSFKGDSAFAEATEKELYVRTDIAKINPEFFIPTFEKLPLENVVDGIESCKNPCGNCTLGNGSKLCYWGYGNSRVVFKRHMFPTIINGKVRIKGSKNVIDEVKIKHIVLLTRDDETPPMKELKKREMIKILEEGRFTIRPGAGPPEKVGQIGYEPYYNPYPPEMKLREQRKFFKKLYDVGITFHLLNTGRFEGKKITAKETFGLMRRIVGV